MGSKNDVQVVIWTIGEFSWKALLVWFFCWLLFDWGWKETQWHRLQWGHHQWMRLQHQYASNECTSNEHATNGRTTNKLAAIVITIASNHPGDGFAGAHTLYDFASACTQFFCQNYIYLFQTMNFHPSIACILQRTVIDCPLICTSSFWVYDELIGSWAIAHNIAVVTPIRSTDSDALCRHRLRSGAVRSGDQCRCTMQCVLLHSGWPSIYVVINICNSSKGLSNTRGDVAIVITAVLVLVLWDQKMICRWTFGL